MERVLDEESKCFDFWSLLCNFQLCDLEKSLSLSLPQFPHLEMRIIIPAVPTSQGCCED